MNRLTIVVDIAGRVTLSTGGNPKIAAGAVAVETGGLAGVRAEVVSLPKWGACTYAEAEHVVDLLASQAVAVAVVTINRDAQAWRTFIADAEVLQDAILRESRSVAGWAKPANVLKFLLLGSASAAATGHAIRVDRRPRILNSKGHQAIECSTVCDTDVQGNENLEVFKSFWEEQHIPKAKLARLGIEMVARDVCITTEQCEPALLLADYAAGLGLAATIEDPTSSRLPLSPADANRLLTVLRRCGKLVLQEEDFDHSYDEIFRDVMAQARHLRGG